ncbi:MBL fold metallo-hydrolase [Brachybacterium hainanense]|uniref:MBL fold metallo-hydrolase n=1 Tax=Brachybacterium hainanense TaxID=1541174 RepID=A0ABV6RFV6_9MICO
MSDEDLRRDPDAESVEVVSRRAPNPGPMTLTGTNSYVLRDGGQSWVVDPGPRDPAHLASLIRLAMGEGQQVLGVLVTHRHGDHSDGAGTLRRQLEARSGRPVKLWAADPSSVPGAHIPPTELHGDSGLVADVIAVPGHTADSVALLVEGGRLLTGDTVLGGSSTVIAPPDGSLTAYLQSLAILRAMALDGRISSLHPGHGEPVDSPTEVIAVLEEAIAHREQRIAQVRAARAAGVLTLDRLIREVYGAGLEGKLREAASWNLRATLEHISAVDGR